MNKIICPNCGTILSQNNDSVVPPYKTISHVFITLCMVANYATYCLMVNTAHEYGHLLRENISSGFRIPNNFDPIITSIITAVLLIVVGLNKLSKIGNYIMLIGTILTAWSIFFILNFIHYDLDGNGIDTCYTMYKFLLPGWVVCSLIYVWTSLYKSLSSAYSKKLWAILICIVLSYLYFQLWYPVFC